MSDRPEPYVVFALTEIGGGRTARTIWDRIGNAFVNRDGSINVQLRAVPVSGKLQLRHDDKEPQGERAAEPTT